MQTNGFEEAIYVEKVDDGCGELMDNYCSSIEDLEPDTEDVAVYKLVGVKKLKITPAKRRLV